MAGIFDYISGLVWPQEPPPPKPQEPVRQLKEPALVTEVNKPWRDTRGWGSSVRQELKDVTEQMRPESDSNVRFFNVLLTGQIGSGKSSFYNSINSIFADHIISGPADTGEFGHSLTKEYRVYEIKPKASKGPLGWRICDTMGLEVDSTESEIRNLLKAVEGHVPNGHKFTPGEDFTETEIKYVKNPTLADKAHCVAIVVDASKADVMEESMWSKFQSLREGLISRNIPVFILLSHIDEACAEVRESADRVYRSIRTRNLVEKVSKRLKGLPENQIFPIKNYSSEVELKDNVDILLLYVMRQMLYACEGHVKNKIRSKLYIPQQFGVSVKSRSNFFENQ